MVFLATPHRGADLAHIFSKILDVAGGPRPYVDDLKRNSLTTEYINEEFPLHSQALKLVSFYETLPTMGKTLIVKQDQAVMSYANERRESLRANHRDVCRYSSRSDPNYQRVRNVLARLLSEFQMPVISETEVEDQYRRELEHLLGTFGSPEDELLSADRVRMDGSCDWLVNTSTFHD